MATKARSIAAGEFEARCLVGSILWEEDIVSPLDEAWDAKSDSASLEDIQYHIYVRQKIERGLEDVEAGRTLSEQDFDQRMETWLKP